MKTVNSLNYLEVDGQETSGVIYFLLEKVNGAWDEAPTDEQSIKMLEILNSDFKAEDGDELYWGAEGTVFEVDNGVWIAA